MVRIKKKSVNEQLLDVVADYRRAGGEWPTDTRTLAEWAINHRRWSPEPEAQTKRLARILARAMREQMMEDPQGRRVRLKHAYPEIRVSPDGTEIQLKLWGDISEFTDDQMHGAAQLQRNQILGQCVQLKTDLDSFNDNYAEQGNIQMSFDFTEDILEREQPPTYRGGIGDCD